MIIYRESSEILVELQPQLVGDQSYRLKEIMGQNTLVLYVVLPYFLEFPLGCYVEFEAEKYHLFTPVSFKKHNSRYYEYTLVMNAHQVKLNDVFVRFDSEITFSLTATPVDFVRLIVDAMNASEGGWTVGSVIDSEPMLIDFKQQSCLSALIKVAQTFETEYDIVDKTIHLGKVEYIRDEVLKLSYGHDNGIMPGLTRQQYDASKVINRLYVESTNRNIVPSQYGAKTLRMPRNHTIEYKGVNYITSACGTYIERQNRGGRVIDGALDLTKHYPSRLGVVSAVIAVSEDKHLYDIIDSSIPEALDYSTLLMPSEKMTIIFQTGTLAGQEFDVSYKHAQRRFLLVPINRNNEIYPYGSLVPAVGDTYKVFNVAMPSQYIESAEIAILNDAVPYLYDNELPKFTYRWSLDGLFAQRQYLDIAGLIKIGHLVAFSDPAFLPNKVHIRIISVKQYLKRPLSPVIEISNSVSSRSLSTIIKELPSIDQSIDRVKQQAISYTQRRWSDAQESIQMLSQAVEGFSAAIDPIAVQTMSLLIGSDALQLRFVSSKTSPSVVSPQINYNNSSKVLEVQPAIIQHMTLGITSISSAHSPSEYRFWDMNSYISPVLTDADKSYYLYAWVPVVGDGGAFLLRETPQPFDAGTYYFLLIGTLGKEVNGTRSYTSVYGFTEILPGQITTGLIKSPTGKTYFDLSAGEGQGEIGGIIKFASGSSGLDSFSEFQDLVGVVGDIDQDIEDLQTQVEDSAQQASEAKAAAAALEYLKSAIQDGSTTVAGGLVLSNLLMLRGVDDVVRAGMSGLRDDNIFLYADTSNAYARALNDTAMFILRKDGTSKLGLMRINRQTVGLHNAGVETLQLRTTAVPTRSDLISSVNDTLIYTGGSISLSGENAGSFGDLLIDVPAPASFTMSINMTMSVGINNDYNTPISDSNAAQVLILEKQEGTLWQQHSIISSIGIFSDSPGVTTDTRSVEESINMQAGRYRLRVEYTLITADTDSASASSSGQVHIQGASANKCIIIGDNGFVRIKDGINYSIFSDEAIEHKFAADKYMLFNHEGLTVRGKIDAPGLRGCGSVISGGSLSTKLGVVGSSSRSSLGTYVVTHDIGHLLYSVNLTPVNNSAQISAIVSQKSNNSFTVKIVNPSNNSLTDSSFDFSIYADV